MPSIFDTANTGLTDLQKLTGLTPAAQSTRVEPTLRKWQKARSAVLSNSGNATIAIIGDSTAGLVGTGTGTQGTAGGQPKSGAMTLVRLLNGYGGRTDFARMDGVYGTHFSAAGTDIDTLKEYDPRFNYTGGWATNSAIAAGATLATTTVGNLTFQPSLPYDRVDVYYRRGTGFGGMTVSSATGGSQTVATAGPAGIVKVTVNVTRGSGLLTIAAGGAGFVGIVAFECYDSTVSQVLVRDMAWSGSTCTSWAASSTFLGMLVTDLTIVNFGLNDMSSSSLAPADVPPNIAANLTAKAGLAAGDFIIRSDNESSEAWNVNCTIARQRECARQLAAYAAANGYRFVDTALVLGGGYAESRANGLQFNDPHPNALGYALLFAEIMTHVRA